MCIQLQDIDPEALETKVTLKPPIRPASRPPQIGLPKTWDVRAWQAIRGKLNPVVGFYRVFGFWRLVGWLPVAGLWWVFNQWPKASEFLRTVCGGWIGRVQYDERQAICEACEYRDVVDCHGYCRACGCVRWLLARLRIKNRFRCHRCPLGRHPGSVNRALDPRRNGQGGVGYGG